MAKNDLRQSALRMRKRGLSYSEIRAHVPVSKSTLSGWLHELPLTRSRINELRGNSPVRIEKFRSTMQKKRSARHSVVYEHAAAKIGRLTKRELYIAGLFLYWAEGTKASRDRVLFTNTDPAMIRFCIAWLNELGIPHGRLRVYLHLYSDMNIKKEIAFWARTLGLPESAFRKPYIKPSTRVGAHSYKGRFNHGTCNVYIGSRDAYEEVLMGLTYIRSLYGGIDFPMVGAL